MMYTGYYKSEDLRIHENLKISHVRMNDKFEGLRQKFSGSQFSKQER